VKERNYALDLLRGLTIALMIIVNNPGDWKAMFTVLRHAEWHGFLGADIVFPLFLFVAGYAAAIRIQRRYTPIAVAGPHCASALTLQETEPPPYYLPLLRRAAILFLIGLFLNAWPFGLLPGTEFSFSNLRVFGVLQRIAICVLVGGVLLRRIATVKGLVSVLILTAVVYEFCMRVALVKIGDVFYGRSFELHNNFARLVDTSILPETMLYKVQKTTFDPEGVFTSLTAIMTFLFGALAFRLTLLSIGKSQNSFRNLVRSRWGLAGMGTLLGITVLIFEPINKNLWTIPYVLLTAAVATALLLALEKVDFGTQRIWSRIAQPFADMGRNPLVIYVLSGIVGKALALYKLSPQLSVKQYLYGGLSVLSLDPKLQSLVYSLLLLAVVSLIARALRRVQLRV
jgi:predicted acyltransferase